MRAAGGELERRANRAREIAAERFDYATRWRAERDRLVAHARNLELDPGATAEQVASALAEVRAFAGLRKPRRRDFTPPPEPES